MYKAQSAESSMSMGELGYVDTDPTGRYGRFKDVLGKGAMKTVYRAFDEVLGMEVAWNLVSLNDVFRSPDDLQRLYSEVHLLSTLNHGSVIRSYTSWINVERRTFNFITEMFTSGTLREYRQRYKRVDIRAVKRWSRQILDGLVYLHGHDPPVIHRDLKCDNIFINGHLGQVKIGDLGLAAILRGSQAHSVIGTPEFMAPELYEEEYNELVDIYSFGMCVLEMLTSEYPYSECCNPAQIYKKVTSGKLPEAFYRIHDLEARRFVGRCLESASKRLPAKELLLDPFLAFDEAELALEPNNRTPKSLVNDNAIKSSVYLPSVPYDSIISTDMTITGKMNPEDDTIFLKVQIADKNGHVRNISFPFDIMSDTPIDVATEMVKELEISDKEPFEIADMIEAEISVLIPHWKEWDPLQHQPHHSFNFQDDDDNDELRHPFYSFSSCSSSQISLSGLLASSETQFYHEDGRSSSYDWLPGESYRDDETSSQSSFHSGKYSNMNYNYHGENENELSPRGREHDEISRSQNYTRFCPEEHSKNNHMISSKCNYKKHKEPRHSQCGLSAADLIKMKNLQLTRIQSCLDVRSQLLHRSMLEEMNKRRLFKTVGAVENIGYQHPYEVSSKKAMPRCSTRASKVGKNQ